MYKNRGVKKTESGKFFAFTKQNGKNYHIGTYDTEDEARRNLIDFRCQLFKNAISSNGEDPNAIVESKELGYFVSPKGNVYNKSGKLMIGAVGKDGYRHIIVNKKNKNIHRIIAESLINNPNNYPCVNHIDGNKLNNNINNLEWCTYSQNTLHAYRIGLEKRVYGENVPNHKLTKKDVLYIRKNYKFRDKTYGYVPLSKKFNVDRTTIRDVVNYKNWKEI